MAVGDIVNYDHLCTRPKEVGDGCYCDSFADVRHCRYATEEHKKGDPFRQLCPCKGCREVDDLPDGPIP